MLWRVALPMNYSGLLQCLLLSATAAYCVSSGQVRFSYHRLIATIAFAQPSGNSAVHTITLDYRQLAKFLASYVVKSTHHCTSVQTHDGLRTGKLAHDIAHIESGMILGSNVISYNILKLAQRGFVERQGLKQDDKGGAVVG
jgi:hypothetical protein